MRQIWRLVLVGLIAIVSEAQAAATENTSEWQRLNSRYCTMWLNPEVSAKTVNRQVSTWRVRPRFRVTDGDETSEGQLAAKCDTLFRRAEELLDMYPPGLHVTIKVVGTGDELSRVHASRYGHGSKAIAIYVFEENTIYAAEKGLSESVLVHEMAHAIVDHYFSVRPPRKIEEMLAMYVDEHLRD